MRGITLGRPGLTGAEEWAVLEAQLSDRRTRGPMIFEFGSGFA